MRRLCLTIVMMPLALGAQTAADHYRAGRAAMNLKPDEAVRELEKAVKLDDDNAEYHLWLGNALGTVAQNASVLRQPFLAKRVKAEFERTVQLDRSNIDARNGLISFYLQAPGIMGGSAEKARAQAEEIAKINTMRGHFARATIASHDKDTVAVEREYRAALADGPDSLPAYQQLAGFLANMKRPADAFGVIDRYVARKPGDIGALFQVGRLAAITGLQLERGEQALQAVLAAPGVGTDPMLPAPAAVYFRLGDIHARQGAKDLARRDYEKALELNPQFEAAKRALKAL